MNEIITGDSLPTLKTRVESDSVDLLVTDPPYGYSFMGKDWDKAVPSVEVWQECLRVLKPGSFAFVMSAPRQDVLSQMIVRLGMAGFDTSFTSIYWTYASGFPKAANVSKLVDKRGGKSASDYKVLNQEIARARQESGLSLKQIGEKMTEYTNGQYGAWYHRGGMMFFETGTNLPSRPEWDNLIKILPIKQEFYSIYEEAEREVIGKKTAGIGSGKTFAFVEGNTQAPKEVDITKAATPQAKALDGSYAGFQPKPAVEVIIVAMKPLSEKTYVDQALANGKGITWLDDCRIPYQNEDDRSQTADKANKDIDSYKNIPEQVYGKARHEYIGEFGNPQGRFPANLLVSDDVLNDGRITKSPTGFVNRKPKEGVFNGENSGFDRKNDNMAGYGDSGSYSRYFDLDKWAEKTLPFLIVPKASKSEKGEFNGHPTVKPLRLMSYLITMGSRPNDIVLDPFSGSGTTCLAAKQLGRQYLGIELSEEYATIARKRLESISSLLAFSDL